MSSNGHNLFTNAVTASDPASRSILRGFDIRPPSPLRVFTACRRVSLASGSIGIAGNDKADGKDDAGYDEDDDDGDDEEDDDDNGADNDEDDDENNEDYAGDDDDEDDEDADDDNNKDDNDEDGHDDDDDEDEPMK